ncbi:PAS domain S-box protein [Flavobacterium sp. ANB]|uniref:sensor histidine kinase n=1 Tax=unclassified Flavobacterium TaxID=196869 RepID=UPI0012BA00C2|nr:MULTISPECIES: ATP-binding protein [unclassified Flavobacterium]MBF4519537.1 PAS domain S-box protein [Flavobacterium sp. ANB]MTD72531.1 PAS domain S-box protein [Flavobacterium sp. LC2016-13]
MAIYTAITFFLLLIILSVINPRLNFFGLSNKKRVRSIVGLVLFLKLVEVIFIASIINLANSSNLIGSDFQIVLFTVASIIINMLIMYETKFNLNKKDEKMLIAEEDFRLVLESFPHALIKSDSDGNIIMANKKVEKMFGYGREVIVGKNMEVLIPHYALLIPHWSSDFCESKVQSILLEQGLHLHAIDNDGKEFPVEVEINPLITEKGIMFLSSIINTTERKKHENIINKQMIEIQQKSEQIEQFNYIASHDLQEPLRTLSNYVILIQEDYGCQLCDDLKLHLKDMDNAVSKMALLVRSISDIGRLGRNKKLTKENSYDILKNVSKNLSSLIDDAKLTIKIEGIMPTLNVYQPEFTQLFQNLISNAVKFQRVGVQPHIVIGAEKKGLFYEFYVKDNGIGINVNHYDRIFQLFQRLNQWEQYQGYGIGLAICQKIVEIHGGKIWVESVQGSGSTFKFTIAILES